MLRGNRSAASCDRKHMVHVSLPGWSRRLPTAAAMSVLAACGGGASAPPPVPPPPLLTSLPSVRLSAASPFAPGCDGAVATGTLYENAEVEPSLAVDPHDPTHLLAAWQQDRWSDGGAHSLVTAASFDTGRTWSTAMPQVAHCAGGSSANGADYERATDPWVAFATDGTAYLLSLSFTGATLASGSSSAMLVLRSSDGGLSWGAPVTLISDGSAAFNDKGAISADATDAHYLYAAWDRLGANNTGPTWFTRTSDGGASWEAARVIYDPGAGNQTIGNIPLSLPDGTLLVVFTEFDAVAGGTSATLEIIRSTDRGLNWSAPTIIASEQSAGVRDPASGTLVRDGADIPAIAADAAGTVYLVWQSSAFSAGARDAIAIAHSADAGQSWSMPVRASGDLAAAAFIPSVRVRADGLIGVGYYDLRNNLPATGRFQADYWLATSADGTTWTDTHVSGPFLLGGAPFAEGLFLGDYQALGSSGKLFLPLFVTSGADTSNRTDVFIAFGP
jgi:hypothetical protein